MRLLLVDRLPNRKSSYSTSLPKNLPFFWYSCKKKLNKQVIMNIGLLKKLSSICSGFSFLSCLWNVFDHNDNIYDEIIS